MIVAQAVALMASGVAVAVIGLIVDAQCKVTGFARPSRRMVAANTSLALLSVVLLSASLALAIVRSV